MYRKVGGACESIPIKTKGGVLDCAIKVGVDKMRIRSG